MSRSIEIHKKFKHIVKDSKDRYDTVKGSCRLCPAWSAYNSYKCLICNKYLCEECSFKHSEEVCFINIVSPLDKNEIGKTNYERLKDLRRKLLK